MLKTLPWRMMAFGGALGVLAGLLAVAFEIGFPDFQGRICEHNQATKHKDCATYSFFPFLFIQVLKTLNDYGAAITGIATAFLTFITWRLVIVARNQSNTAQEQLRAYVFASDVKVLQFATIPHVTAQFKNFGQTPCDEITFSYNIKVDDLHTPKGLCIGPAPGIAPMAPGFGFHMDSSLEVTHEQRSAIVGGNAISVMGPHQPGR